RGGRTTDELQELLDDILVRPGLALVVIFDPTGRVVAQSATPDVPPPTVDEVVQTTLRSRAPVSTVLATGGTEYVRVIHPFRWTDGRTAAVEVRQSLFGVERDFQQSVREGIVSRLAILLCFVVSIVAVTRWSIARPLRALARGPPRRSARASPPGGDPPSDGAHRRDHPRPARLHAAPPAGPASAGGGATARARRRRPGRPHPAQGPAAPPGPALGSPPRPGGRRP